MKKRLFRKGLVLGIILLFVAGSISPLVTAIDNVTEVKDEDVDNFNDSGTSDDYKEIITFISGGDNSEWINRKGFFRGEIFIYGGSPWGIPIALWGLRLTNGKVEKYSMIEARSVHAYFFRGFIFDGTQALGYALGNIDWV